MVRTRSRKPAKLEPEPKPETQTLPPLRPTPVRKPKQPGPNTSTIQIMKRVWSKFDVIVVMKGIVDYIAEMGVDPMSNLDGFVEFINKNSSSSSYNGFDCCKITWNLGKNGVNEEKNCTLHLESRNFDDLGKKNGGGCGVGDKVLNLGKNDCGKSVKKKGSVVDDARVLNLGKNDSGSVKKNGSVVENLSNSGKNDGDAIFFGRVVENMLNSGKNDGVSWVSTPSSGRKKSCVSENKSNLRKNDGGVSCASSPGSWRKKSCVSENGSNSGKNDDVSCVSSQSSGKKSNLCENKSNSRKNDGDVSSLSSQDSVNKSNLSEKEWNLGKNDGGVSCLTNSSTVNKLGGWWKGDCQEIVVGNDQEKSKLGMGYGGVNCTETLKDVKKRTRRGNRGGVNRWTFGGRIRRTTKGLVVGKKSIPKGKSDGGGNKQNNSNKNGCRDHSGIQDKKGGVKTHNGGNKQNNSNKNGCRNHSGIQVKKGGVKTHNGGNKQNNSNKNGCRNHSGIQVKKGGVKTNNGGNKQNNSNKNGCRNHSGIQVKKGGVKTNNGGCANLSDFGCWDKNEVMLREAVRRMISRRLSLRDELETDLLWCPPKTGVLKWNTDASVREDDNKAAIGGVLRDWNGSFRCVFSCPLDCCESNEAEVRAIYKALELASCKDWLLNIHMVIESDSMNAVRWCNEENGGPLNLGYMLNFIRECRRWWPGLEITYMGRKSNSVADRLSKQGHERNADFVAWM